MSTRSIALLASFLIVATAPFAWAQHNCPCASLKVTPSFEEALTSVMAKKDTLVDQSIGLDPIVKLVQASQGAKLWIVATGLPAQHLQWMVKQHAHVVLTHDLGVETALAVVRTAAASDAKVWLAEGFPPEDLQSLYESGASCVSSSDLQKALKALHDSGQEVFVREADVPAQFLSQLMKAGADRVIVEVAIPDLDSHDRYRRDCDDINFRRVAGAVTYAGLGARVVVRKPGLRDEDSVLRTIVDVGQSRVWFVFQSVSGWWESNERQDMAALAKRGARIILDGNLWCADMLEPALTLASNVPGKIFVPSSSLTDFSRDKVKRSSITVFEPTSPPYRNVDPRQAKFSELNRRAGIE